MGWNDGHQRFLLTLATCRPCHTSISNLVFVSTMQAISHACTRHVRIGRQHSLMIRCDCGGMWHPEYRGLVQG